MAIVPADKPLPGTTADISEPQNFGAYAGTATAPTKTPETTPPNGSHPAKQNGSLDFIDSDKRWLKELGITTTHPLDFQKVWSTGADRAKEQHLTWKETYKGRIAMRAVSRGVVGTIFYAAAQMYAGKALERYKLENTDDWKPSNFLEHAARIIDKTVGNGIRMTVKAVTGDDEKALRSILFRDTVNFGNKHGDKFISGRTLGHEAVAVTFDFATMSFADYMTRYVVGLFDPNVHNAWMKNGHLQPSGAFKDLFYNIFRGFTYAAGEDMAVALPYVYYMRLQRHVINKFSPGFKIDADLGLNGGSFKLNDQNKIVGNYQLEGMLDLMGRFSWYNVGTKMFRDGYNAAENKVSDWWNKDPMQPKEAKPQVHYTLPEQLDRGVRYVFRTTFKTMMYMIPSTFFFYALRSPQTKFRGVAIHPEKGVLGRYTSQDVGSAEDNTNLTNRPASEKARFQPLRFTSRVDLESGKPYDDYIAKQRAEGKEEDPKYQLLFRKDPTKLQREVYDLNHEEIENPFTSYAPDAFTDKPYDRKADRNPPWHDIFTNPLGKLCYNAGSTVNFFLKPLNKIFGLTPKKTEIFARTYANASLSYTPYFMAKTDIGAAALDTKRMDMAIDRLWHGMVTLSPSEFKAGAGEVFHTVLFEPFSDPLREEKAQEKMLGDPEKRSNEAYQSAVQGKNNNGEPIDPNTPAPSGETTTPISTRAPYGRLHKPGEPWTDWIKAATPDNPKPQAPAAFSQNVTPHAASWTAAHGQQQETTAPQGQTVH